MVGSGYAPRVTLAMFVHPGVAAASQGETLRLDGEEGHHAAVVRRVAAGEQVATVWDFESRDHPQYGGLARG